MHIKLDHKINMFRFFEKFLFVLPFYAVMFEENGLSATQIATLFIVWKLTTLVCEYPTGLLADKYSRKAQIILAQFLLGLGFLCWILDNSYPSYMLGFILWGISSALKSGTFQAFVYDKLKEEGREDEYKKVYARSMSAGHIGFLLSAALATLFFKIGSYNLTIALSIVSIIISTLPIFFIKESTYHKSTGEVEEWNFMKEAFLVIFKNRALIIIVMLIASFDAIGVPIDEYTTLLAVNSGIQTSMLGIFFVVLSFGMIIGSELVRKVELTYNQSLVFLFFDGLLWVAAALFANYITIFLMFLDSIFLSVFDVTFENNMQELVPSKVRASVSSIKGLITKLLAAVVLMFFGIIADFTSLEIGFVFLGGLLMLLPILLFVAKKKFT